MTESKTFWTQAPWWKLKEASNQIPNPNRARTKYKKRSMQERVYPNRVVAPKVILINSLEPTNIIMRMGHQVDIDFTRNNSLCGVVFYITGFCTTNTSSQKDGKQQDDRHRHHRHRHRAAKGTVQQERLRSYIKSEDPNHWNGLSTAFNGQLDFRTASSIF